MMDMNKSFADFAIYLAEINIAYLAICTVVGYRGLPCVNIPFIKVNSDLFCRTFPTLIGAM